MRKMYSESILIIFTAVIAAIAVNLLRPSGNIPFTASTLNDDNIKANDSAVNYIHYVLINIDQAYSLWKNNKALFIDARTPNSLVDGKIPGAVNIPAGNEIEYLSLLKSKAGNLSEIVIYCSDNDSQNSLQVAKWAVAQGYEKVYLFTGGVASWSKKGYGLEK